MFLPGHRSSCGAEVNRPAAVVWAWPRDAGPSPGAPAPESDEMGLKWMCDEVELR